MGYGYVGWGLSAGSCESPERDGVGRRPSCGRKGVERAAGFRPRRNGERGVWGVMGVWLREDIDKEEPRTLESSRCSVLMTRIHKCFHISSERRGPGSSNAVRSCGVEVDVTKYNINPAELGSAYSFAMAASCADNVLWTCTSVPRRNWVW